MSTTKNVQQQKSKRVHITIPADLCPVFEHLAAEAEMSLSMKVVQMAKSWVEEKENQIFEKLMKPRQEQKDTATALSHNQLIDELGIEV